MSDERLIAIVSIPKDWANVDISKLPKMRVEATGEGSYSFPEKEVINAALKEMFNSSNSSTSSAIFMVVDIAEGRRRRRATPRAVNAQGNARGRRRRGGRN